MDRHIRSVLIVEDDSIISISLKMMLESSGFEVCDIASSGVKALRIYNDSRPDAVLLDINLKGGMTGIDICNELKKTDAHPVVIYITGYSDEKLIRAAEETMPRAIFEKPVDVDDLIHMLGA